MKPAYGETIRGEVSIFRGGAGGLSYFSSGSFNGAMLTGASWAEAISRAASENRQINRLMRGMVEHLMCGVYRFGGTPALHRCAKHCGQVKPLLRFEILSARSPNRRGGRLPLIQNKKVVDNYFPFIW